MSTLPTSMRAARAYAFDGDPASVRVDEVEVPRPGRGEVLVRMLAAPINPNDLMLLEDRYLVRREAPSPVGFEGAGVVVECGGGVVSRAILGRRVACTASDHSGTWAEYAVCPATRCVPLRQGLTDAQGATMLTNPFTAWVLFDGCRREGHAALIQTAPAGSLGRMIVRLCHEQGLGVLHIVRTPSEAEELRGIGAEHVLVSSADDFDAELTRLARELGATVCLDAVGGRLAGRVLAAMPADSTLRIFGDLSGEPVALEAHGLLFDRKRVEGFNMYDWTRESSLLAKARVALSVQRHLEGALAVQVRNELPLRDVQEALRAYRQAMGGGKLLLRCDR
jgi:NADPH:quinone reductase-like Zn-dependent oxidoreductase